LFGETQEIQRQVDDLMSKGVGAREYEPVYCSHDIGAYKGWDLEDVHRLQGSQ